MATKLARITILVTISEKRKIRALAKSAEKSVGKFIRDAVIPLIENSMPAPRERELAKTKEKPHA